jgi:hypothetical protein
VIRLFKGLYLYGTTQYRNINKNIHASSRISSHDPSNQVAKTYTLDCAATGTGTMDQYWQQINMKTSEVCKIPNNEIEICVFLCNIPFCSCYNENDDQEMFTCIFLLLAAVGSL